MIALKRWVVFGRGGPQAEYCPAFWAGDGFASVITVSLQIMQAPQRGEDLRFGPSVFYLIVLPLPLLSLCAFWAIGHWKLGFREGGDCAAPADSGREQSGGRQMEMVLADEGGSGDSVGVLASAASVAPLEPGDSFAVSFVEPRGDPPPTPPPRRRCSFVPAGMVRRPLMTAVLGIVCSGVTFASFGVGESVFPFACKQCSPLDKGLACTAYIAEGSMLTSLTSKLLVAACGARLGRRTKLVTLSVLFLVCVTAFSLMCLAARIGGMWASLGSWYMVAVVLVMHLCFTAVTMLVLLAVAQEYVKDEVESINMFFIACVGAANTIGVGLATVLLPES